MKCQGLNVATRARLKATQPIKLEKAKQNKGSRIHRLSRILRPYLVFLLASFFLALFTIKSPAQQSDWKSLGGKIASDLSCVVPQQNSETCLARATDGSVWQISSSNNQWY